MRISDWSSDVCSSDLSVAGLSRQRGFSVSNGFSKWFIAALPLVASSAAHGETLRQALIHAYRTNPSLTAARAGLRATDEGVPIAKAAGRPTLSATADYQEFVVRSANSFSAPLRSANANANLTRSEEHTSELQ